MIDNKLKKCCEHCCFLDIQAYSEVVPHQILREGKDALETHIRCRHMNVCKDYIEETEKEKVGKKE